MIKCRINVLTGVKFKNFDERPFLVIPQYFQMLRHQSDPMDSDKIGVVYIVMRRFTPCVGDFIVPF